MSGLCRIGVDCPEPFYVSYDSVNGQRIISRHPISRNADRLPDWNGVDTVDYTGSTLPAPGEYPMADGRFTSPTEYPYADTPAWVARSFFGLPGWVGALVVMALIAGLWVVS